MEVPIPRVNQCSTPALSARGLFSVCSQPHRPFVWKDRYLQYKPVSANAAAQILRDYR